MTSIITEAMSGWQAWAGAGVAALLGVWMAGSRRSRRDAADGVARATANSPAPIDADDLSIDAPCAADWLRASEQ